MIVALVQQSCRLMQEIDEREQARAEAQSVEDTVQALTLLRETATRLQTSLQLLGQRCPAPEIAAARRSSERCATQLTRSAEQFVTQPRQKSDVQAIHIHAQKALEGMQRAWQTYAIACMHEPFDLYRLVASLPEVVARQATYDELQRQLRAAGATMPTSDQQLQAFDQALAQFKRLLHEIEGLSAEVRAFLLKTLDGTASLADVGDEVLQWCRQGRRARTFAVRFAHEGREVGH